MAVQPQQWQHTIGTKSYLISTDKSLLDRSFITAGFASSDMYWTKAVSERSMDLLIAHSCVFGLYQQINGGYEQVGLARLVTDYATLAYLTDVLIAKEHRGNGLGKWLIQCVDDVVKGMEDLRRYLLLTGKGARTVPFYDGFGLSERSLEEDRLVCMVRTGPGSTKALKGSSATA